MSTKPSRSFKTWAGWIPSRVVNWMMQPGVPRSRAAKLISLVNRYPQWFSAVDRRFLTQTSFGFAIWCDRWDVIGQTIIAKGQWEGLLSRTILALLRPADIAIDIGAKIGYDTMLMSKAVGREGKVLAFEPDLDNLALLLQNLCQLEHSNVLVQSSELLT